MKRVIVITGTPGTGKSTLAKKLKKVLGKSELIDANMVVKENKLFSSYAKDGAMIVKMQPLRKAIERRISLSKANYVIVEGHLLCDMKIKDAVAIVVRERLPMLLKRFSDRNYKGKKVEDNIVSEAIDYCGVRAASNYENVYEIMGGNGALKKSVQIAMGKSVKGENIEMLGELNGLLSKL